MEKKYVEKIINYSKKLRAINYLGGSCMNCKESNFFKLTFHHRNTDEKEFTFSSFKTKRWSILKKEIDKCDLLCQNCHRELHYQNEPKFGNSRRIDKKLYLEYKGAKCIKCEYNKCDASLTFHHRNPDEKEFSIGKLSERLNSLQDIRIKILEELDKCDILCANCHVLEHSDVNFYEQNEKVIVEKSINYKEIQPKLNKEEVIRMFLDGMKQIDIAKRFNSSKGTISGIVKKWKCTQ